MLAHRDGEPHQQGRGDKLECNMAKRRISATQKQANITVSPQLIGVAILVSVAKPDGLYKHSKGTASKSQARLNGQHTVHNFELP